MTLERFLVELKDLSQPLRISKLTNLSRLADEEGKLFAETWPAVEAKRRREVVGHLVDLAEDNLTLDFDLVLSLCLKDPDPEVRSHALAGLAQNEDPSLIGPIIVVLQGDPEEKVRAAAASALAHFVLLAELGKLRASYAAKLESALSALLQDATQPLEVRRRALEAISPLSKPQVKEFIQQAYRSDSLHLKVSALYAMGQSCDPCWLPTLIKEMGSADSELRYEAAVACGEMEDEVAVPHLLELIHDRDAEVKASAIEALGRIGGSEARDGLRRCLNDPDPLVQEAAQEALQEMAFFEDPIRPFP